MCTPAQVFAGSLLRIDPPTMWVAFDTVVGYVQIYLVGSFRLSIANGYGLVVLILVGLCSPYVSPRIDRQTEHPDSNGCPAPI
jgi:hypothetical protein